MTNLIRGHDLCNLKPIKRFKERRGLRHQLECPTQMLRIRATITNAVTEETLISDQST